MDTTSFLVSLRLQIRVIRALVKRELLAMYGRKGLGFLTVFAEPLVIMGTVMTFVSLRRLHASMMTFPVVPFVLSGWGVMWICRLPIMRMGGVLQANNAFLYHRYITVFDIFLGRLIIWTAATVTSFAVLFAGFMLVTEYALYDMSAVVGALLLAIWYAMALSLLCNALATYTFVGFRLLLVVSIGHVFITGALFMVDWVPYQYRGLVMLSPMVSVTEWMRYGFFGNLVTCYYDLPYVLGCNLVLTYLALQVLFKMVKTRDPYSISH